MSTIYLQAPANLAGNTAVGNRQSLWTKFNAFAAGEAKHRTLWFMVSMIVQGVFFLPIPAILIYYFGAPVLCVILTMGFFFTNVILGMGGSSIRTMIAFFVLSIVTHLLMLAVYII